MVTADNVHEDVILYDVNGKGTAMKDEGLHGDAAAGDGIYSCTLHLQMAADTNVPLYAACGQSKSDTIRLEFLDMPTQEEASYVEKVAQDFEQIEKAYIDENGYVPDDSRSYLLDELTVEVLKLYDDKTIIFYNTEEDSIEMKFASGITYVYIPKTEDVLSAGASEQMSIVTMDPYHSSLGSESKALQKHTEQEGEAIAAAFKNYTYPQEHAFIYLNACKSGVNANLANAFLENGAAAVIANSNTIYASYASSVEKNIITSMTQVNADTGNYYSLKEALQASEEQFGKDDASWGSSSKSPAYTIIYGGTAADTYRFGDINNQNVSQGTITDTSASTEDIKTMETVKEPSAVENQENCYAIYKQLLDSYGWINYCISDLSEIPKDQYDDYWMGTYNLYDINKDGVDELSILAGQSMADMSMTFFTCKNGKLCYLDSVKSGNASLYGNTSEAGVMTVERQGGLGHNIELGMQPEGIHEVNNYTYQYKNTDDLGPAGSHWDYIQSYSVHDTSALK